MKIYTRELVSLCTFSREIARLGYVLNREDEVKFVFERAETADTVLLFKNYALISTANYIDVAGAFDLAFNMTTIEDTEIEAPLQDGESLVELINRLNRLTESFRSVVE